MFVFLPAAFAESVKHRLNIVYQTNENPNESEHALSYQKQLVPRTKSMVGISYICECLTYAV